MVDIWRLYVVSKVTKNYFIDVHFYFRYNFQEWLDKIEDHYFNERDDLVRQTLQSALENTPKDPFGLILHIMHRAFFDLYSKRLPITFIALDEINVWLQLKVLFCLLNSPSYISSVYIDSL